MGGSLKFGEATASLIVGKWSAASRQNTLAAALKEWGRMRRTIHAARYLSDPVYRRKISWQLNKGGSLHALRRDLHYAQQGTIVRFFGFISVDIEAELAKLIEGWRPLRPTTVTESGTSDYPWQVP